MPLAIRRERPRLSHQSIFRRGKVSEGTRRDSGHHRASDRAGVLRFKRIERKPEDVRLHLLEPQAHSLPQLSSKWSPLGRPQIECKQIVEEFTPEELTLVELLPQFVEAPSNHFAKVGREAMNNGDEYDDIPALRQFKKTYASDKDRKAIKKRTLFDMEKLDIKWNRNDDATLSRQGFILKTFENNGVLRWILEEIEQEITGFKEGTYSPLFDLRTHNYLINKEVKYIDHGEEKLGRVLGINDDFTLKIFDGKNIKYISSGEIDLSI